MLEPPPFPRHLLKQSMEMTPSVSAVMEAKMNAPVRILAAPDSTSLQQARDTLVEVRSKFDLSTVERNIRAIQLVSRIQGIDKDLQTRCFSELKKYKLIKEILDSDIVV